MMKWFASVLLGLSALSAHAETPADTLPVEANEDRRAGTPLRLESVLLDQAVAGLRDAARDLAASPGGRDTGPLRGDTAALYLDAARRIDAHGKDLVSAREKRDEAVADYAELRQAVAADLRQIADFALRETLNTFEAEPSLGDPLDMAADALLPLRDVVAELPPVPDTRVICVRAPGLSEALYARDVGDPLGSFLDGRQGIDSLFLTVIETPDQSTVEVVAFGRDIPDAAFAALYQEVTDLLTASVNPRNLDGPLMALMARPNEVRCVEPAAEG